VARRKLLAVRRSGVDGDGSENGRVRHETTMASEMSD